MRFLRGPDKVVERADSGAAIRLGDVGDAGERSAWGLILVVFMRLLAALWVFQGLSQWAAVLTPREPLFSMTPALWGAAVIFFAILDLLAAVGLWLATPWGGVLWLFSATAQIFVIFVIPAFFAKVWLVVNIALIVVYFLLTWQAGRPDADAPRARRR